MAAPPKTKPPAAASVQAKKPLAAAKNAKKRPSPKNDSYDDDSDDNMDGLDDVDFVLASVTPAKGRAAGKASKTNQAAKKARSKAPAAEVDLTGDSDLDFHSDGDASPPAKKKPAPARARSGRAISKQPVYNLDSEDESDEFGDDSDSD
jgi:hypothetical protein